MAGIGRTKVALRFFGADLDPDELTKLLGVEPTACTTKGEVRTSKSGRTHLSRTGSWRLSLEEKNPGDLADQLKQLFALTTDDLAVWRHLTSRYRADVFCGLFMVVGNEGLELDLATLHGLAERGLSLGLDIYDPTPD